MKYDALHSRSVFARSSTRRFVEIEARGSERTARRYERSSRSRAEYAAERTGGDRAPLCEPRRDARLGDGRLDVRRASGRSDARAAVLVLSACALLLAACSEMPVEPRGLKHAGEPLLALFGPVAQLSVGDYHSCAIGSDGTVSCWGSNYEVQSVAPAGVFTHVAAGGRHTCAIRVDGTVACWGFWWDGQTRPPAGTFTQLAVANLFSCGLRIDQSVVCWGYNEGLDGSMPSPSGTFTQISAGMEHACGVRTDGTVVCWGWGYTGQGSPPPGTYTQVAAGYFYSCGLRSDGTVVCWGNDYANPNTPLPGTFTRISARWGVCGIHPDGTLACDGAPAPPTGTFTQVGVGRGRACALRTDGSITCWGSAGEEKPHFTGRFTQVSAHWGSVCALRVEGDLSCWNVPYGGSAQPIGEERIVPAGVFTQVATGDGFACALQPDHTVLCWGSNSSGQASPPAGTFAQLSAGEAHACAVGSAGAVACWGWNGYGQTTAPSGAFTQVSAGIAHSCALRTDGTLVCWGRSEHGEASAPAGTFTQVSAGNHQSCALRADAAVVCWGSPGASGGVPAGNFTQVSAGYEHACALRTDGAIACWGDVTPEGDPVIPPPGTFTQISVGESYTCAVRSDQTLDCWGETATTTYVPGQLTPPVLVGAGDLASCTTSRDEATARLLDDIAGHVFTLGDNAYADGSAADFTSCYGPTWGRHLSRTRPAAGDKEYRTAGAPAYFGYFGAAAGDPANGYYSYDIPNTDWHVVVLNSNVALGATSPQIAWLKADLAASNRSCTVAYWHKPRFYSSGIASAYKPAWDVLYAAGVDVVINGDRRNYERFAPQDANGVADPAYGIRQFIAGTGGAGFTGFGTPLANSEVRIGYTAGVLKLTLEDGGYAWQFVPVAGQSATDQGTGSCHGAPPPVARPGGQYRSESAVAFDGSASTDPQGDLPLTYAWDFGDGATATGAKPTHAYATAGSYTVTLVVTDAKGNRSAPATTTAFVGDQPPAVVEAGPRLWATTGAGVVLDGAFSDGLGAPWSWRISWGDGTEDTGTASAPGPITATHVYASPGDRTVTLTVSSTPGGSRSDHTTAHITAPGATFTLLTAGNIARCGSGYPLDEATAKLIDGEVAANPAAVVFTLGDNAYPQGRTLDYANCYQPTWGRHRDRTFASLGNRDYASGTADGTHDYFGTRAGPRGKGYYSIDLGNWHIVVLNDNNNYLAFAAGSEQEAWLRADLAANTKPCVLAIWHNPRFYSTTTTSTFRSAAKVLWERLYAARADVVLNAHYLFYERMAPMQPNGVRDDVNGIRQFTVGTGGEGRGTWTTRMANSEVIDNSPGVLKLTLRADGYDWQFLSAAGFTFTDTGSGSCH